MNEGRRCTAKRIVYSNTCNRVLFVERSGELRPLARLSDEVTEPKGNQVLTARQVSERRPETG